MDIKKSGTFKSFTTSTRQKFTIGDEVYDSFEDLPEEYKAFFDKDGDGKVDVFEEIKLKRLEENEAEEILDKFTDRDDGPLDVSFVETKTTGPILLRKLQVPVYNLIVYAGLVFAIGYYAAENNWFNF